ncbi:hypothetical protein FHG87_010410 [Trinorchestia longiramus]|nr:hypothetical protein FHG87_010410 [Trinorchestia longiramus]
MVIHKPTTAVADLEPGSSRMGAPLLLLVLLGCASVTSLQEVPPDVQVQTRPFLKRPIFPRVRPMRQFAFYATSPDEELAKGILAGDPWRHNSRGKYNVNDEALKLSTSSHTNIDLLEEPSDNFHPLSWYDELDECTDETMCMRGVFPPPPSFNIPPPPLPPFFPNPDSSKDIPDNIFEPILAADDQCSWCKWAVEDNITVTEPEEVEEWGLGIGGMLAGVAVGSALTGAILTVVLIRCRRSKVLPTGEGSCLSLPRTSWTQPNARGPRSVQGAKPPEGGTVSADSTARTTGWAMKLWRRHVSQDQTLRTVSAYSSENSYTEEPYMNPDSQSAVYAELGHGLNTYSEIPDPGRPMHEHLVLSDYGYGNSAYALSEANSEPAESSSTPSSAYYSDVSSDARVNKKKRKKKRGVGREQPDEVQVPSTSVHIATGSHSNPLSVCHLSEMPPQLENYPSSVRVLPRAYSLERQVVAYPCVSCPTCTPMGPISIPKSNYNITPALINPCTSYNLHHAVPCPIPGSHGKPIEQPGLPREINPNTLAAAQQVPNAQVYQAQESSKAPEDDSKCPPSEYV